MLGSSFEMASVQIEVYKKSGPYHGEALLVRCEQFLLAFTQCAQPIADGSVVPKGLFCSKTQPTLVCQASVTTL